METSELRTAVRERDGVSVIDLAGDLNSSAEAALNEAYATATAGGTGSVVLNFEHADYINSTGIALVVGLLAQARRNGIDVREVSETARVIDIEGDITAHSEDVLMDAYGRASGEGVRAIVLNFTGLDYMNSGGIGLLVTLLVRAQRHHQHVLAYGLSDHYRQIFEVTRLDEAVGIHDSEP